MSNKSYSTCIYYHRVVWQRIEEGQEVLQTPYWRQALETWAPSITGDKARNVEYKALYSPPPIHVVRTWYCSVNCRPPVQYCNVKQVEHLINASVFLEGL